MLGDAEVEPALGLRQAVNTNLQCCAPRTRNIFAHLTSLLFDFCHSGKEKQSLVHYTLLLHAQIRFLGAILGHSGNSMCQEAS